MKMRFRPDNSADRRRSIRGGTTEQKKDSEKINNDPSSGVGEYKYYSALVTSAKSAPASYWGSSKKSIEKSFSKLFAQITGNG